MRPMVRPAGAPLLHGMLVGGKRWRYRCLMGWPHRHSWSIQVDSGRHRTGVRPQAAGDVGKAAVDAGLDVVGVFTFPGHDYGHDAQARERAARDEERTLGEAAQVLRDLGLDIRVINGGSTPTVGRWQPGAVSELRPGVYVFNDATQLAIGTCGAEDLALVAAATVISVPAPDRFVLDMGSKVLGADRSPWVTGTSQSRSWPQPHVLSSVKRAR